MFSFLKERKKIGKNILILLTQDIGSPSGLGRYFPISKYLVKQGFSVTIGALHSDFGNLTKRDLVQDGVQVHYVGQMHVKKRYNQTLYYSKKQLIGISLVATSRLLKLALQSKANLILIGKPHPMNSIAGLLAGLLTRKRVILDCDDYEAVSNRFGSKWQYWIVKLFEDLVPRLATQVTTNTYFNLERMVKLGIPRGRITYLPNGVDQARFSDLDLSQASMLKQKLGLSQNKIVAYIGSLSLANHPVDLLLESFVELKKNVKDAILLIVGGGGDLEALQSMATEFGLSEKVIFCGRVEPHQAPYYYQIADITVDPVYDTDAAKGRCPLKMFESWMAGTPFVTADVGDRKILAGDPPAALLAKPGDAKDLAEQIFNAISYSELSAHLSALGRERVKAYLWEEIVAQKSELFK